MTDITRIMSVIETIKSNCNEIDKLEKSISLKYQNESLKIGKQSEEIIANMKENYDSFKSNTFLKLKKDIDELVNLITVDYGNEWDKIPAEKNKFDSLSYGETLAKLCSTVDIINLYISKLNGVNFDELVPPIKIEMADETFKTTSQGRGVSREYNCNSSYVKEIDDPKPLKELVSEILPVCKDAEVCIDALISKYDGKFNIKYFESFVKSSSLAWLSEFKAKVQDSYSKRFDELFVNENADAISKDFFARLISEGEASSVDVNTGTDTYNESITLGKIKMEVSKDPKHLEYIKNSPVLNKYLEDGYMLSPFILDLKKCGNILLNISEDDYMEDTVKFVNQVIIQFLLSFPANRINFCLIDIDNKMGFSQFKSLTKINNGILFNGIIRDDRQLENTIKDMEQTMYKVDDDILSYNNVEDIYEYNKKYEANPQSVHLFVIVNYPSGMREDIAKRILKIMQNGNKAGIFTLLINNKACKLSPAYKAAEYGQFIESAQRSSVVINKKGSEFDLNMEVKNSFVPQDSISVSMLPSIIDMLKNHAETNRQKVIKLNSLFEDIDRSKERGIASSAEVLDIPIGARGGEIQNILLKTTGDGSAHAVVIGGTGSGKSNLLHTIILSACYKYSPDELNFYLIDFKGGVEFKFYEANKIKENQIPHIKLTGLTSDLEDGVAILNNLHKELRRREDEFRNFRVEDIVQYRNLGKKMPRLFVIIDEIQELFEQDDRLSQKAIDILRELFKKGRAFGINILWASQNIPNAPGLKDKVLSQIGNRISLRLNEPDDALDIKIDPKVVKNLNRPEKGLGVINDIRYGNESVEFRVAFAESSENRHEYSKLIIDKWKGTYNADEQAPLFIVGDDDESSAVDGNTVYTVVPSEKQVVPKSFENYILQLGQDYVTGKPFDISIPIRENKSNIMIAGYDIEIIRDMMGYSLLSVIMNQLTDSDCELNSPKIYYANGEMINPKNSKDLFNILSSDFKSMIENVSSTSKIVSCIKDIYRIYKERSIEADGLEYAKAYSPYFIVIHSMQRYLDIFSENPKIRLNDSENRSEAASSGIQKSKLDEAMMLFSSVKAAKEDTAEDNNSKMPDSVFFCDAFKELLNRGGTFGIHFIISLDNPLTIPSIKNDMAETRCKIFVKGVNTNVISQLLGDYKIANSLNNPKIALVSVQDEHSKIRVYRYSDDKDASWYGELSANYKKLKGSRE